MSVAGDLVITSRSKHPSHPHGWPWPVWKIAAGERANAAATARVPGSRPATKNPWRSVRHAPFDLTRSTSAVARAELSIQPPLTKNASSSAAARVDGPAASTARWWRSVFAATAFASSAVETGQRPTAISGT